MGRDKALVEIDGRRMIERVIDVARKVAPAVALVAAPGKYADLGLPTVSDNFVDCGPLAGIEAALGATGADWNLALACDMPSLRPELLERLFAEAEGWDGAMPEGEPLCAVYHRRCRSQVRAALDNGVRKVMDGLAGLAIRQIPVMHEEQLANLNTPEELCRYQTGGSVRG